MQSELFEGRVKRLLEVNEVIAKLAPSIQGPAFQLLVPYVTARAGMESVGDETDDGEGSTAAEAGDFETFLAKHTASDTKPARTST